MKLNYKRTFFMGLAFMSICAFWQMYDSIVPLMLSKTFKMNETITGFIMALDNILAVFLLPALGAFSDKVDTKWGKRTPFIVVGTILSAILLILVGLANRYALSVDADNAKATKMALIAFVALLFLLLVAMGLYRSPAVALMPDLTPKPLRSQANAVINLMGAIGGVYALVLISVLTKENSSDYLSIMLGIVVIMIIAIIILPITIKEKKLAKAVEEEAASFEAENETDNTVENADSEKLPKEVKKSLIMILLSIALWFTAYNAVTTAWSRYAETVWNMKDGGYANCLMVGTVAACLSYIPIGILAAKVGRKKTIILGIILLFISYLAAALFSLSSEFSPFINIFFVLIGVGWAAINVNSLPMVVEMCKSSDVGKYTGLYYTFSMSAQIITPILSGVLLQYVSYKTLFPYACFFMVLAFITMTFVKHGDNRPGIKKNKLEYLDVED